MDKKKIVLVLIGLVAVGSAIYYFKTKKEFRSKTQQEIEQEKAEKTRLEKEQKELQLKKAVESLGGVYKPNITGKRANEIGREELSNDELQAKIRAVKR